MSALSPFYPRLQTLVGAAGTAVSPEPAVSNRSNQVSIDHLVGAGERRLLSELVPNVTVSFERAHAADYFCAFASASSFSSWLTRSCSADKRELSSPTLKNVTLLAGASSVLP